jgi:hypothetical protein
MSYTQERIFFGTSGVLATIFSGLGAVMSAGELRWLCVTITVSIITSSFLALIFKRDEETIRMVVGRSGFAILCGVFGSKYMVHRYDLRFTDHDIVALGGVSCAVCIGGFIVGYVLLQVLNKNAPKLADKLFRKWLP